jgi:hypothetical protein
MDCAWVSRGGRRMPQNRVPHSAWHSWIPLNRSALGTPWNYRGATMAPIWNCTGLAEPLPEGSWRLPWKDHHYGRNLGSLVRTTLEAAIRWLEASQLSSSKESAPCTRWCEDDVHCGVWHPRSITIPCCTSTSDGKCCLLLQFLGTPPSSSTQEKAMTLVGNEPHHPSWQCEESHC